MRTEYFEVRALASPLAHPRVGLIVPRHRHTAVDRNRLKRRLREVVRVRWLRRLPPVDLVVRARPNAYQASFRAIESDLAGAEQALSRLVPRS